MEYVETLARDGSAVNSTFTQCKRTECKAAVPNADVQQITFEELAPNAVRPGQFLSQFGGARRTLCGMRGSGASMGTIEAGSKEKPKLCRV